MKVKEQTELNSWIAINVMGWTVVDRIADLETETVFIKMDGSVWIDNPKQVYRIQEWSPITDSAQAMAILEKCAIRFCVTINHLQSSKAFLVGIKNVSATAATLPEAICLFARKVMA